MSRKKVGSGFNVWFVDTETFKYDWLMVAINPSTRDKRYFVNDLTALRRFYEQTKNDIWVAYNGASYDQYIIKGLLLGFNPKEINDWIIVKKRKGWEYSSTFNKIKLIMYDAMPSEQVGLKALEGFMGHNIHETSVSFKINRKLTPKEIQETLGYCEHDVMELIEVFIKNKNEFDSHYALIKQFNLPIINLIKTQAQLAAKILNAKRVELHDEWEIRLPEVVQLGKYQAVGEWFLNPQNHDYEKNLEIEIAGMPNVIAWGGLHGGRKKFVYVCKEDEIIFDIDVDQLYPTLMIVYKLLSRAVRDPELFKLILETSLRLKAEKKKKEREPYKRICNIVYGATGDPYNPMYDPLHRNLVCVFGQVLIIDLIDKIDDLIFSLNHNTDGIFVVVKKKNVEELKRRIHEWEQRTQLHMSYDEFTAMYSKDVNNYVAVRADGSYHSKGSYVKDQHDLDYDLPIINEAVKSFILNGTPTRTTVESCTDLRKFQKIVKLSEKFDWVEHERGNSWIEPIYEEYSNRKIGKRLIYETSTKFDNKAYRVFASNDSKKGRLLKCKTINDGRIKRDKFAMTPDNCFIMNENILGKPIPAELNKEWYINEANKRLREGFGIR